MTRELIARAIDPDAWTDRADMGMRRETSLRAADRVLAVLPGWQPIETAPKDGACILGCIAGLARPVSEVFWWGNGWRAWDGVYVSPISYPTHWMPLPAAPTEEQPR